MVVAAGEIGQCANPDCAKFFRKQQVSQECCCRSCARVLQHLRRQPTRAEQIEAVLRAIRIELEKVLK